MISEIIISEKALLLENYLTAVGIASMGVFCILSFLIEKSAAKGLDGHILFVLVFINLFLSLAWPMAMSFIIKPEFLLGNLMSLCSVSLFLKLFSYHHVLLDVRILNKRIVKYKKEKSEMLKPN